MPSRGQAFVVGILGLVGLNVVYLWDLILGKHQGWVMLGWKAAIAILIGNLIILAALVGMRVRRRPTKAPPS